MAVQEDSTSMRFGNYEVLSRTDGKPDELGRGGFGRTYRARHSFLGTEMALKVIIDRLAFDEAAKKRFLKEAREHARLNHPGIARIADFGEAEGTFFYAMELCPDGDLKEYVKKTGPVPPVEALQLIRQTAEALFYAHRRNILHRDIKPSNLLLVFGEATPQVKLIDFGLVKRIVKVSADETIDHASASQWSPAFASPEQIRELALDERTDVFSLGMTAWFLIAGGGPVEGATMEIVQDRLSPNSYEPRLPPSLTGRMREIVARMIEKDTAVRYRNFGELLEDLRQVLDGAPAISREPRQERRVPALADRFTLERAGRVFLGEVFRGMDRQRQTKVKVTLIYKEHDPSVTTQTAEKVKALATSQPSGLVPLLEMTEFEEGWVVVEEDTGGTTIAEALRREGAVPFMKLTAVLWDAATGVDAAVECGAVPAPLEQALLEGGDAQGTVDWTAVQIHIPFQLARSQEESEVGADVTVTRDAQQSSPLKAFASLVYLAVGGRHATAQAFYSSSACIAIPGLSSHGNHTLAACLAGEGKATDCRSLMQALLADEGIPFDGVVRRAQERRLKALDAAISHEVLRIDRAVASVDVIKAGRTGTVVDEASLKTATNASARATKLTADLAAPGGRTETFCREALQELRALAIQAEAAAAVCAERSQKASRTATASATATKSATATATAGATAASTAEQMDALHTIEAAARQAKESSDQILRLKMPRGMDDSDLSRQQVEARRLAREAAAAVAQAQDLVSAGKFDSKSAATLSATAAGAAASVSLALDIARRLTAVPDKTAVQPRLPEIPQPQPVNEEPAIRLQPAVDQAPAVTVAKKKSSAGLMVVIILVLAAAGGGGWYFYNEQQKKKKDVVITNDPPKTDPKVDPLIDPKIGQEDIPQPPVLRQMVLTFTGDLPESESLITFPGTEEKPKAVPSTGKLDFIFSLPKEAPNPRPSVDPKRFTMETLSESPERIEYKLTRPLPPASLRLTGITAVNPGTVTIGGRYGKVEGDALFFTKAAETDGRFHLDTAAWQPKGPPKEVSPGVWEAAMELKLFEVKFTLEAGATNPWKTVTFVPASLEVLPPLRSLEGLGQFASTSDVDLKFSLNGDEPEAARVPAGEYTLKWTASDVTVKPLEGVHFTVSPDQPNVLPLPPVK